MSTSDPNPESPPQPDPPAPETDAPVPSGSGGQIPPMIPQPDWAFDPINKVEVQPTKPWEILITTIEK
jgi:hypothetical protein